MKVKVEQVNRYLITIGDRVLDGFVRCDEWEGMIKFIGPHGTVIVDAGQDKFENVFESIFGRINKTDPVEFNVLKATTSLLEPVKDPSK